MLGALLIVSPINIRVVLNTRANTNAITGSTTDSERRSETDTVESLSRVEGRNESCVVVAGGESPEVSENADGHVGGGRHQCRALQGAARDDIYGRGRTG